MLNQLLWKAEIAGSDINMIVDELVQESPLFKLDSITVPLHVAWYSERSLNKLCRKAAENVVQVLQGEAMMLSTGAH